MTIREYLKSLGATDNELLAKVVKRMEDAMLFDSDLKQFAPDTVLKVLAVSAEALNAANGEIRYNIIKAEEDKGMLEKAITDAERQLDDLKKQTAGIKEAKINSPETRDAVMAYAATLNATREIFGADSITPEVMVAAINAGSYIAWRGIMGPKNNDVSEFQPRRLR
jgi:hypothetical protein